MGTRRAARIRSAGWMLAIGSFTAVVGLGLTFDGAAAGPNGNNGTVKIAGEADLDEIPDHEPHQNCVFTVQWYNFDQGAEIISKVSFELQSPTDTQAHSLTVSGPANVFVGADPPGGAGNDLDGEAVYSLSFTGLPHLLQGYHVKITVHTPDSKGNDSKSKVFWVLPCLLPPPTPTDTPTEPRCPRWSTPASETTTAAVAGAR